MLASAPGLAQQESNRPRLEGARPAKPRDPSGPREDNPREPVHRLESVTWDAIRCELTWVVSTGMRTGREYTPSENETYKIAMDTAIMQSGSERRRFEMQEADNVHLLMDMISRYAAESTIWWQQGEGEKIKETGTVARQQPSGATTRRLTSLSADGLNAKPHAP